MAKVQDEDAIYDEINVVPMLDLAYVPVSYTHLTLPTICSG